MKNYRKLKRAITKNHSRSKYLHAFQKIANYQAEINKLQDMVIGWIVMDKRKKRSKSIEV